MKKERFDKTFQEAIDQLRSERQTKDFGDDFERGVWTEIALHDERWTNRLARLFREGLPAVPARAMAVYIAFAVFLGVSSALVQANAYGASRSAAMEERYVSMIHPVLRSESEEHHAEPL